jgi:RNA polymerase sigma factor (sigma-70 family)
MAIRQAESIPRRLHGLLDAGMVAEVSDAELLGRFTAERDAAAEIAFAALVRRHGPMVFRVCRQIVGDRHTAEDAFQATFLILARRAGSIHGPELLGNWLHGVAFRTAREARMREHRRQRRECAIGSAGAGEPVDRSGRPDLTLVCREEFEALHEEVSRLPERYRVPVVLCDLEGLTYQDAALRLGCPVGTIGVRLRRARERLRARMARRGLAPTASLLATLLAPAEAASAIPPPVLVESTIKAAMGFVVNPGATAELARTPAIALTERILQTMAFSRFKAATHLALAVGITAAVAWFAKPQNLPAPAAAVAGETKPSEKPTSTAPEQTRYEATAGATPVGDAAAANIAERPSAGTPKVNEREAAPALPADVFAGALETDDRSGNESRTAIAKPAIDPAVHEERLAREERGRGAILFSKEWMPNDPRSHGGDGLGPVYNEASCVACHGLGGAGGAGPESKNVVLITASPNGCGASVSPEKIHPGFRGSQSDVLHRYGTEPEYASWQKRFNASNREGQTNAPSTRREESVDGRIQALKEQTSPGRRIRERSDVQRSMNGFNVSISERNTPPLFGVGLIDEIPSEVLVALAARQPAAIRGRVNRTKEGRIGKFGSKAQVPTLHEFVRGACANELGLEVPGHAQGASPMAPEAMAKGLDLTEPECDDLVAYVRARAGGHRSLRTAGDTGHADRPPALHPGGLRLVPRAHGRRSVGHLQRLATAQHGAELERCRERVR